ncbi:hypothetical protein KZ483_08805 [Paenibacillus sp. sptzw28]|uniref:hypothetical protein n=1 Tax=Paenibacillus sp. sptzw28 TaxID=715179 RepID=UPI001C6F16EC|nr:hypothetical protein [Paenibacillus sp. sptzw28]QYR23006.1 hypothetical protein KZ483_08805 [Paenibacillus sp. sptzw28]
MKKFFFLLQIQHLLYFRWFVTQFFSAARIRSGHVALLFAGLPVLTAGISYFVFRAIFLLTRAGGYVPEADHLSAAFSVIYMLLGLTFITDAYKEVYIRAFHSKDTEFVQVHYGASANVQLIKLIDVYAWKIVFPFVPLVIGGSIAFNAIFTQHIPAGWYTTSLLLLAASSLAVRILVMTVSFLRRNGRKLGSSAITFVMKSALFAALGYFAIRWVGSSSLSTVIADEAGRLAAISDTLASPYIPSNWLLSGHSGWYAAWTVLLLAAAVTLVYRLQDRFISLRQELPETVLNAKRKVDLIGRWNRPMWNLFAKDLMLLSRDHYNVLPSLRNFVLILMVLIGIGTGIREMGWLQSPAVSFSAMFAAQLMLSSFAGFLVSRATSVDAEGMMMQVLLTHLRTPKSIYKAKIMLHFTLTTALGFMASLILSIVLNLTLSLAAFSLLSLVLINLVSSLASVTSSAMYPRFDWEDESRIGTSEKASLIESLILRGYELMHITVMGTSGAMLYGKRITEELFFAVSAAGIVLSSMIWCAVLTWLLTRPWWKEWRL